MLRLKNIKNTALMAAGMLCIVVLLSATLVNRHAFASTPQNDVCQGVGIVSGTGCSPPAGSASIHDIVVLVVNILSFVVGVAAVIMIIIGGFKYVTSQGEPSSTASAKNTILYAIVGLVVVALSQVIVRFVLGKIAG